MREQEPISKRCQVLSHRHKLHLGQKLRARSMWMTVRFLDGLRGVVLEADDDVPAGRFRKGTTFMAGGVRFTPIQVNGKYLSVRAL